MNTTTITDAVSFFMEYGGYSYDPKTQAKEQGQRESAEALAKAEAWAAANGVSFTWSDDDPMPDEPASSTCEICIASRRGEIIGSLGAITDATDEYRRVVQAELALEAMPSAQTIRYLATDDGMLDQNVRAKIFGILVSLSQETITHYQSDYYHDAMWLTEHLTQETAFPFSFFYAWDNAGSAIGTDPELVGRIRPNLTNVVVERADDYGNQVYHLTITPTTI
jgi:hypothetical protein